jgi:hypothetical protein
MSDDASHEAILSLSMNLIYDVTPTAPAAIRGDYTGLHRYFFLLFQQTHSIPLMQLGQW